MQKVIEATNNTQLLEIWEEEGSLDEKYEKWNDAVMEVVENIFSKPFKRKKKMTKKEIILRKAQGLEKLTLKTIKTKLQRQKTVRCTNFIHASLAKVEKKKKANYIEEVVSSIKNNAGVKSNNFDTFRKS